MIPKVKKEIQCAIGLFRGIARMRHIIGRTAMGTIAKPLQTRASAMLKGRIRQLLHKHAASVVAASCNLPTQGHA